MPFLFEQKGKNKGVPFLSLFAVIISDNLRSGNVGSRCPAEAAQTMRLEMDPGADDMIFFMDCMISCSGISVGTGGLS